MSAKRCFSIMSLLVLGGCLHRSCPDIDHCICARADLLVDAEPFPQKESVPAVQPQSKPKTLIDRLGVLPPELPGASTAEIKMPDVNASPKEKEAAINKYFPPLPPLGDEPSAQPGPAGAPLTLADLQKLALTNSPTLRQAAADVEAARGIALQSGLYPNPTIGVTHESVGPGGGPRTGGFINQTLKFPGKLRAAQNAALVDARLTELKLQQAEADLRTQVRSGYFAVLTARENLRVNRAMARLTDEIFRVLVLQLKAGEVATYEPMQVRVLALQARGLVVQAHNRYIAAWKQLASSLGLPGMPLTQLAGRVTLAVPKYEYDKVLAHVLTNHTEVAAAEFSVDKAREVVRLASITPMPDVDVNVTVVNDGSPPGPARPVAVFQVGLPVPLFDRNQGNIHNAQSLLARAGEEAHRVRADLSARLAEAFERYRNNRVLLEMYANEIIPNQVQAFRAVVARHSRGGAADKGGASYNDLVTAEQTLVNVIANYLAVLRDEWTAVIDVAGLLQTTDLFQLGEPGHELDLPDLEALLPLCCCHPCSPVQEPRFYGADGSWPESRPARTGEPLPPPRRLEAPQAQVKPAAYSVVPMPVVPMPVRPFVAPVSPSGTRLLGPTAAPPARTL